MSFDPVSALFEVGSKILDRVSPDPKIQAEQRLRLAEIAQRGDLAELDAFVKSLTGQLEINKTEAAHKSIFVAGWRPAVGWVCATGLGWNFIIQPLLTWGAFVLGVDVAEAPRLDISELITILGGMLGLGAMRMREKEKGVASDSMVK